MESLFSNVLQVMGMEVTCKKHLCEDIISSQDTLLFLNFDKMCYDLRESIRRIRSLNPGISVVLVNHDPEKSFTYPGMRSILDGSVPPDPSHETIMETAGEVLSGFSFLSYLGELNRILLGDEEFREFYGSLNNLYDRTGYIKMIDRIVSSDLSENGENMYHIARVGFVSKLLSRKIGLDRGFCSNIQLAAPLHDVGMVEVPRSILSKPGQLSINDWQEIKRHSKRGREILGYDDCPVMGMAADICFSHHERWDERGYPEGLGQGNIPTPAFITSVADSFDVMVSSRTYKKELLIQDAFAELRNNKGKQFSPICVYSLQSLRPLLVQLYTEVCGALVQGETLKDI